MKRDKSAAKKNNVKIGERLREKESMHINWWLQNVSLWLLGISISNAHMTPNTLFYRSVVIPDVVIFDVVIPDVFYS